MHLLFTDADVCLKNIGQAVRTDMPKFCFEIINLVFDLNI